jgi:patatin-related protein
MSNQRRYYHPKFIHEIQLGLVVHSGVSLAIYTHGVCQEFYNAVRGRGIYKLIKALTDADLVVDSISGSSAGGINGILLSYALTNSNTRELVDFNAFASIWRNNGDLLKLLHKPNIFKSQPTEISASNDNFYHRGAVAVLERGIEHKMPRPPQEWYSESKELDLAIAGTNYLGKLDRTLDETGINVGIKNYRTLFHLKHRQGRKQPFDPTFKDPELPRSPADTYQALAKLCQITAGTPMIFPLVEVDVCDRQNLVDRQLTIWGKLEQQYSPDPTFDRGNNKLYFLDGGLLDNAPFTCALEATYYRLPHKPGQRKLFYVDPNPEHLTDRIQLNGNKKARAGRILQPLALSIPIQQSITNDLRTIHEHNQKVRRYHLLIDRAEATIDSQQVLASADDTQDRIYLRGRLFDFRDRNLPLLLHSDLSSQNTRYSAILEKIEVVLVNKLHTKQDRVHYHKLLARFEPQVVDLDVEYIIRKHFYTIDRIADLPKRDLDSETYSQLQNLSLQLSCNIKLLEVVRAGIQRLFRDRSVSNYFYYLIDRESNDRRLRALVYELIFRLHRFLLDERKFKEFVPNDPSTAKLGTIGDDFWQNLSKFATTNSQGRWLSQTQISSIFAQIDQRITDLHQSHDLHRSIWVDGNLEYDNNRNQSFPSILKRIAVVAEAEIARTQNRYTSELLRQWHAFDTIDREIYPFEYLTSLSSKQIVTPICISPENAQLGIGQGKSVREKLGGNKLYNIGGIFKKSWRSNDLLWGRLDGLNRIIEGIVTPGSVVAFSNFVQRESVRVNCSGTQYLDWLLAESLPHVTGVERDRIMRHLDRLARPEQRVERAELKQILADIVLAGQREILTSDVHSIVEGLDEQPGWWRFPNHRQSPNPTAVPAKHTPSGSTAPTSNPNTIVRIVHQSLTNLAAQQQHFFRNQYRVGVDKLWENMPLVTLVNLCTKLVLTLRNMLVKVFGKAAIDPATRHPLYHWLDGVLQSIYWWLQGGTISVGMTHRRPRIILLQFLGAIATISGFVLAFLLSPLWLLFSLPGALVCWCIQSIRLKRLTAAKNSQFLPQSRE